MSIYSTPSGITIIGSYNKEWEKILSYEALRFIGSLHRQFNGLLLELLERRKKTQRSLNEGASLGFLSGSLSIREEKWEVAAPPPVLRERKVEIITGAEDQIPSGGDWKEASGIIVDLEDGLSPTWKNVIQSQLNLYNLLREEKAGVEGDLPVLHLRPRGIHLFEKHVHVDGEPIGASFFDFGLYFFHNAKILTERQGGPFFYIPKIENQYEAEFWKTLFAFAENGFSLHPGTIRATIILETITAAFEIEEILYNLKNYVAAMVFEPRDYVFSVIRKLRNQRIALLPDRSEITIEAPFLKASLDLLAQSCHKRGTLALFELVPLMASLDERDNLEIFNKIREEQLQASSLGVDGYIVAHPRLIPVVKAEIKDSIERRPAEAHSYGEKSIDCARDLLNFKIIGGEITESGVRNNLSLVLRYLSSWFSGKGAVVISNVKEDGSSAEVARSQLWQWIHLGAEMDSKIPLDKEIFLSWKREEKELLSPLPFLDKADKILEEVVLSRDFIDFLTLLAYEQLQD
uniref:malate synthase n=1 Tax=Candidatus Methylacidiphilum infernorum TaxID=511746 RepID=A0A1W5LCX4_9BACT|nr:malate synthase [Candidatus Methylacidiphilum infernorum]